MKYIRNIVDHLTGIDISSKMIEVAEKKGIYDELHTSDILEFLRSRKENYDLFIASDVFVYIGDLNQLFETVGKMASPKGCFVFSTEHTDTYPYVLLPSGRYAYSRSYIKDLTIQLVI